MQATLDVLTHGLLQSEDTVK